MVAQIEEALEQQRFVLHYQPQYAIDTQRIIGVEALVRMVTATGDLVGPDQFIGLAEETGLIVPLGRWVLETACQQLKQWQRAGNPRLRMAINVSPIQLMDDGFISMLEEVTARAGVSPADLELELTEQQVVENQTRVVQVFEKLHAKGVRLVMDDFGTGYSSLACLTQLPISAVKIDRAFLTEVPKDPRRTQALAAIIRMV